jgi:hypothetical protein
MSPTSRLLGPKLPDFREEENYNLTIRNGLLKVNHFSLNQTEKEEEIAMKFNIKDLLKE